MWMVPLVIGGTYASTSILFLKFPHLLPNFVKKRPGWYSRKPNWPKICHISHRGGAGEFYENTFKAFKSAKEIGTQMLELDVHLTKDNVVVVSHDGNLKRATGKNVEIKDFDFSDLPKLQTHVAIDFLYQQSFSSEDRSEEHISIPTLEEVFRHCPDLCINIDIKTYNETLIEEVNKLVKKYDREDITVWCNFQEKITQKCYETNGNIGTSFSIQKVLLLLVCFYSGLLPYVTFTQNCLEIPMIQNVAYKKFGSGITTNQKILANVCDFLLMRPLLFEHLLKRGIPTYVWVLNSEEEFDRAFKLGVTGVMTDYPTLLRDYLEKNPQYDVKNGKDI